MVNSDRARLLIEELRSGTREQGFGKLNTNGKFCCLGVACEVAIENGLDLTVAQALDTNCISYDGYEYDLPTSVQEWYGFTSPNPVLKDDNGNIILATLRNDGKNNEGGETFAQIADAFEYTLNNEPQLFSEGPDSYYYD